MSHANGDGTHEKDRGSHLNRKGAIDILRSLDGSEGLLQQIISLSGEHVEVLFRVLDGLLLEDEQATRDILRFLLDRREMTSCIGTSLNEIISFADPLRRSSVRKGLHEFPAQSEEELVNPDVLSEAQVLRRWLRIYGRYLEF